MNYEIAKKKMPQIKRIKFLQSQPFKWGKNSQSPITLMDKTSSLTVPA